MYFWVTVPHIRLQLSGVHIPHLYLIGILFKVESVMKIIVGEVSSEKSLSIEFTATGRIVELRI